MAESLRAGWPLITADRRSELDHSTLGRVPGGGSPDRGCTMTDSSAGNNDFVAELIDLATGDRSLRNHCCGVLRQLAESSAPPPIRSQPAGGRKEKRNRQALLLRELRGQHKLLLERWTNRRRSAASKEAANWAERGQQDAKELLGNTRRLAHSLNPGDTAAAAAVVNRLIERHEDRLGARPLPRPPLWQPLPPRPLLTPTGLGNATGSAKPATLASTRGADTDWRDVQRRLLRLHNRGEPYTSIRELARRLGCSNATISKAIKDSAKLKRWRAEHRDATGSPRATGLSEVVINNIGQTREPDPSDRLPEEESTALCTA